MVDKDDQEPADGLPPLPGEVVEVVRTAGRLKWIVAFVGVIAVIAGLVIVVGGSDDIDADEALDKAQAFVEDAESYRFELLRTSRLQTGDPDGTGSDTTTRAKTTGQVADRTHWQVVEDTGGLPGMPMDIPPLEVRRIGGEQYSTGGWADDSELPEVDAPAWVVGPMAPGATVEELAGYYTDMQEFAEESPDDFDDSYLAEQTMSLLVDAYLLPVTEDPAAVERLIVEATDPVVEEELADGGVRLRARLAPIAEFVEASKEPLAPVDLLLDLDGARRPVLAKFTSALEQASTDVEVRYEGWGEAIEITAPSADDVDQTPWLQEELLATVPDLLLVPTALPEGWFVSSVSVYRYSGDCAEVDIYYGTPAEAEFYEREERGEVDEAEADAFYEQHQPLNLMASSADCALETDSTPFDEELYGFPARNVQDLPEIRVGDVVVTIYGPAPGDEARMEAILRSLRVVTVEELAAMMPPEVQQAYVGPMGGSGGPPFSSFGVAAIS